MDYQEAIETLQDIHDVAESRIKNGDARGVIYIPPDKLEDLKTAISAMQELQELHDHGFSLDRMKDIDFRKEIVEHINYDAYMRLMDELEEYKQLGTLEEVREVVEKNTAKKPKQYRGKYHCPRCTRIVSKGSYDKRGTLVQRAYSCKYCFQRFDWGEEE